MASAAMFAAGCQQFATYPPVEITANLQRPAAEPVPTIIAESARYVNERHLEGAGLAINLPEGVPHTVYDRVFTHLDGGRPMLMPNEPAIHFTEIRTRAMNAQVDLMYPSGGHFYQLVTLTLEYRVLDGWRVKSERKWVTRNLQPPPPHYVAPPLDESETTTPVAVRPVSKTASAK